MKYRVFEKVELWKESVIEVRDYYDTLDKVVKAYNDGEVEYLKSIYLVETEKPGDTKELWSFTSHDSKPLWTNATTTEGLLFEE